MKLTKIVVGAWNQPDGRHTRLTRYYTNPDMDHTVWLSPDEIETYLYKDRTPQPQKAGIQHLTRP